ncbi:sensor histidine kinase [Amycolatopsis ultiminotia]|uniref:sensor histidine kinase n=1 Tax=Amycolatopsis ultiminotia TaxID=543629 RepID=UPI0031EA94A4
MTVARGANERELDRVLAGYAVRVRAVVILPCAVLGVLVTLHWSTAVPAAIAVGWCVLQLYWLRKAPPGPGPVAFAHALVVLGLGLSQWWTGAQPVESWLFALVSVTVGTTPFEWGARPAMAAALSATTIGAYLTGTASAGAGWGPALRLVVETALAWTGYLLLRRAARSVDRATARAAAARQAVSVAAARHAAEREYLATLHDTASTTLMMAATGGRSPSWLPERAAQDLAGLAAVPEQPQGEADLAGLLGPAAEQAAVTVTVDIRGPLVLPAIPAQAILHGVREALTNVQRHAGVDEAHLSARLDTNDRIVVEVRDRGRGFAPGIAGPHRRGVSGSIVGRMAASGGRAVVESRPGAGSVVRWVWPDG